VEKKMDKTMLREIEEDGKEFGWPLVVKYDGLCNGKGVGICRSKEEVEVFLDRLKVPIMNEFS
jgi:phosphoribosylamine-glycine ligase